MRARIDTGKTFSAELFLSDGGGVLETEETTLTFFSILFIVITSIFLFF